MHTGCRHAVLQAALIEREPYTLSINKVTANPPSMYAFFCNILKTKCIKDALRSKKGNANTSLGNSLEDKFVKPRTLENERFTNKKLVLDSRPTCHMDCIFVTIKQCLINTLNVPDQALKALMGHTQNSRASVPPLPRYPHSGDFNFPCHARSRRFRLRFSLRRRQRLRLSFYLPTLRKSRVGLFCQHFVSSNTS